MDTAQLSRPQHPVTRTSSKAERKLCYTTAEACAALSVSPKTLARLAARGCPKSLKALRTKLYPHSELLRFMEESK